MGIARVKQLGAMTITCVGKGCGTYPYMAPEMFKASVRRGVKVDINIRWVVSLLNFLDEGEFGRD